jgi:DNA-directed RNA polymerase subunit N (RpoN/RPB10)
MYPPIVCTCGRSLGDLYDCYKHILLERTAKYMAEHGLEKIKPEMLAIGNDTTIMMGDILNQLGISIHMDCCRKTMLGVAEFKNFY